MKNDSLDRPSIHMRFTGAPGTGKTTVARIIGKIFREEGILRKGAFLEYSARMLCAEYVGQTAVKTAAICRDAYGSVLFIDEAYTLARNDGQDTFGQEAIDTLLKRMEDDRSRLVVIVAGYTDEMKAFIESNPGLSSRFNRYIEFPDYSEAELLEIFKRLAEKQKLELSSEFKNTLKALFSRVIAKGDSSFGNGRGVRNLYEKTLVNQANRLAQKDYSVSDLMKLLPEDLPADY
jgi:SpoVK/Ycf46/Vps4 family AAA+-type ATPase